MRRALLAAIPLLLVGCAAGDPSGSGGDAPAHTDAAQGRRYQTTAMVLDSRDHGPELCLGVVFDTLPPQCEDGDGLPITNWRWDQVEDEQTAGGTTWGGYRLVGTYDGAAFTVLEVDRPPPERRASPEEEFKEGSKPACPEPDGGWRVPVPAKRSQAYLDPVTKAARAEPDFAGIWLAWLEPMSHSHNVAEDAGEFVLNVAFTGDLARHEAELRPKWGGRLCVTRQQRSYRELQRIQYELQGAVGKKLGLRVLLTGLDESVNAVYLTVVVLEERARQALEARYGDAVRATARLTPVD